MFLTQVKIFQLIALDKSGSIRGASHQPAFMRSCLLVTRVCPVYLVNELVLVFYPPFGLMVALLIFISCILKKVLVLWEVGAILGDRYGIQEQNYVPLLQGSGMPAGFHYKNLALSICFRSITMNVFQQSDGQQIRA